MTLFMRLVKRLLIVHVYHKGEPLMPRKSNARETLHVAGVPVSPLFGACTNISLHSSSSMRACKRENYVHVSFRLFLVV